jgi:transcriptional regulator with GAF, ATPase, and Fis domain
MEGLFKSIKAIASLNSTVLITGESGTGKELIARAIHELSQRKSGPFVPVNCAGLDDELSYSLLFGHLKGAFTGAEQAKDGFIMGLLTIPAGAVFTL